MNPHGRTNTGAAVRWAASAAFSIILFLPAPATIAQTPIDDFSDAGPNTVDPPGVQRTTIGSTTVSDGGLSGVIGSVRQLTVEATAVGGGSPLVKAGVTTGAQRLDYSSSVLADGLVRLLYDAGGSGLNADLSLAMGVELQIVSDVSAIPYIVSLTLTDGGSQTVTQNIVTSGTQNLQFDFDDFNLVDLTDLFSVEVLVDPNQAGDLEMGIVTTFGEPFCGDGITNLAEECDDGNGFSGDGCEPDCTISLACTFAHGGTPNEVFVGACGAPNFGDIQSAVNASSDGDIVSICPGTYNESVVVTREVTLRSTGGAAVTTVQSPGVVFDVRRSGVRIEDLTLTAGTTAVEANMICPLGQSSCPSPGKGSNLIITGNVITGSPQGIAWERKVDCVTISNNTMDDNDAHIRIVQADPEPAIFVEVTGNTITNGGSSGAAVRLEDLDGGLTIAQNTIEDSSGAGLVLADVGPGTMVVENDIRRSATDGITILPGAAGTRILQNNIEDNAVGLGNEAPEGILDATLNWWDSQTGPFHATDRPSAVGDEIQERAGGLDTLFIEFLCQPAPGGFPSVGGECDVEQTEIEQLAFGRGPDISATGRYVSFISDHDLNGDDRIGIDNSDGGDDVFVLNRKPSRRPGAFCLGGANPMAPCNKQPDCVGDPNNDPIINDGVCVLITQVSNDPSGTAAIGDPRLDKKGDVFFATDADLVGANPDGSLDLVEWVYRDFRRQEPSDPNDVIDAISMGAGGQDTEYPAPGRNGRRVGMESTTNPVGQNGDGNREIFLYDTRKNVWTQLTNTIAPVDNMRPAAHTGRRILFDSNGDLHNDPKVGGIDNADGNRELFLATTKRNQVILTQLTDTVAPVENRAGALGRRGKLAVFSSNGDFTAQNADGNREIFVLFKGSFEQITHSTAGENVKPASNPRGRFVTFESTANLEGGGGALTNRRVFLFDRKFGTTTLVSRSFFGSNFSPRISNGRFIVWESTANLTGHNAGGDRVIYIFDRRRDN